MKLLTNLIFEPKGKHDPALAYNIKDTVMSADGRCVYFALQDVPVGIALDNADYWIKMLDVSDIQGGNGEGGAVFSVNGKTGAVELSAEDVGALPEDTPIPDVSAFITRAVSDLEYYYLKSQTYTRTEIDQKISAIPKFSISVVSALPSAGISATTIYLVPGGADNNLYTEYINVNGTWEILGSQRIDLTGYATQNWTLEQLKGYQPKGNYLTEHQDISHKLDVDKLPEAIDDALAQAKESGEFDGKDAVSPTVTVSDITGGHRITITDANGVKYVDVLDGSKGDAGRGIASVARTAGNGNAGTTDTYTITYTDGTTTKFYVTNGSNGKDGDPGYTPQRGVDYYTEADKAEWSEYIASELAKRGQLKPEFANDISECEDESLLYVLPDGYIYAYMAYKTNDETVANFENVLDQATIKIGQRYSLSSGAFKDQSGCDSIIIPIPSGAIDVHFRGITLNSSYTNVYGGTSAEAFTGELVNLNATYDNIHTDANGDKYFSCTNSSGYTHMIFFVSQSGTDYDSAAIAINELISYTTTEGGTVYEWASTGRAFVPADYEDRIVKLEDTADDLKSRVNVLEKANYASALSMMVYSPSPQLPADGSETADFNAANINANEIYAYIDALVAKHPRYLTKETLGKDESGTFDWNLYTASRRTYDAWVKLNYPAMYAWVSGSTTVYSVSVSPRVGDTMYSTAHVGTSYSTVTAVDTPNQTRTVNGLVFSRDKSKDIAPTLVYTLTDYDTRRLGIYATWHNAVYNASKSKIGTISTIAGNTLTDSNGNSYNRYPMGDRDKNFTKLPALVIGSNEHGGNIDGDPAEPAIITARLIKDLCECRNADNAFLNMLKSEYMIVFCPIINPWGYGKENGYCNANGVNIDRNFDTPGWGGDSDQRHGAYGGSENETQYFMNTLVESGAKIALANHCLGLQINVDDEYNASGFCGYMLGRDNAKYNVRLAAIAETMSVNYDLTTNNIGQAPGDTYGKTRSYMDHIGIEGGALEMSAIEGYLLHGGTLHTAKVLESNYTLLLQFLQMLIDCQR